MRESFGQGAMKNLNLQIAVVVTAALFGVLTALLIRGILTPRSFGIAGIAAMVVCGSLWYRALKYFSLAGCGKMRVGKWSFLSGWPMQGCLA